MGNRGIFYHLTDSLRFDIRAGGQADNDSEWQFAPRLPALNSAFLRRIAWPT